MNEEQIETIGDPALDPADRSLFEDLRLLAEDARTLAEAEVAYQKSRAAAFGAGIGKIVALGAGALVLVFLAMIALVVGLVLALTPLIGAWGATAVVTVVLVALAVAAGLWARSNWRRLAGLVFGKGDAHDRS